MPQEMDSDKKSDTEPQNLGISNPRSKNRPPRTSAMIFRDESKRVKWSTSMSVATIQEPSQAPEEASKSGDPQTMTIRETIQDARSIPLQPATFMMDDVAETRSLTDPARIVRYHSASRKSCLESGEADDGELSGFPATTNALIDAGLLGRTEEIEMIIRMLRGNQWRREFNMIHDTVHPLMICAGTQSKGAGKTMLGKRIALGLWAQGLRTFEVWYVDAGRMQAMAKFTPNLEFFVHRMLQRLPISEAYTDDLFVHAKVAPPVVIDKPDDDKQGSVIKQTAQDCWRTRRLPDTTQILVVLDNVEVITFPNSMISSLRAMESGEDRLSIFLEAVKCVSNEVPIDFVLLGASVTLASFNVGLDPALNWSIARFPLRPLTRSETAMVIDQSKLSNFYKSLKTETLSAIKELTYELTDGVPGYVAVLVQWMERNSAKILASNLEEYDCRSYLIEKILRSLRFGSLQNDMKSVMAYWETIEPESPEIDIALETLLTRWLIGRSVGFLEEVIPQKIGLAPILYNRLIAQVGWFYDPSGHRPDGKVQLAIPWLSLVILSADAEWKASLIRVSLERLQTCENPELETQHVKGIWGTLFRSLLIHDARVLDQLKSFLTKKSKAEAISAGSFELVEFRPEQSGSRGRGNVSHQTGTRDKMAEKSAAVPLKSEMNTELTLPVSVQMPSEGMEAAIKLVELCSNFSKVLGGQSYLYITCSGTDFGGWDNIVMDPNLTWAYLIKFLVNDELPNPTRLLALRNLADDLKSQMAIHLHERVFDIDVIKLFVPILQASTGMDFESEEIKVAPFAETLDGFVAVLHIKEVHQERSRLQQLLQQGGGPGLNDDQLEELLSASLRPTLFKSMGSPPQTDGAKIEDSISMSGSMTRWESILSGASMPDADDC